MSAERVWLAFGTGRVAADVTKHDDSASVRIGDHEVVVRLQPLGLGAYAVEGSLGRRVVYHATDGRVHYLHMDGEVYTFTLVRGELEDEERGMVRRAAHHDLRAPMPGVVTRVLVREGQRVAAGAPLFVLEAMKMETVVRAAVPSVVTGIRVGAGERVDGGGVVVEVDEVPAAGAPSAERS